MHCGNFFYFIIQNFLYQKRSVFPDLFLSYLPVISDAAGGVVMLVSPVVMSVALGKMSSLGMSSGITVASLVGDVVTFGVSIGVAIGVGLVVAVGDALCLASSVLQPTRKSAAIKDTAKKYLIFLKA